MSYLSLQSVLLTRNKLCSTLPSSGHTFHQCCGSSGSNAKCKTSAMKNKIIHQGNKKMYEVERGTCVSHYTCTIKMYAPLKLWSNNNDMMHVNGCINTDNLFVYYCWTKFLLSHFDRYLYNLCGASLKHRIRKQESRIGNWNPEPECRISNSRFQFSCFTVAPFICTTMHIHVYM